MPGLTESSSGCRVMILPETAVKDGSKDDTMTILRLKHPRTEQPALYLLNSAAKQLYEILSFSEEHRCWFIGERIVDDGTLLLSTPVDPTFLILPSLISAERNVPLDDLLDCPEYPQLHLLAALAPPSLSSVANQLGDSDLNVWRYDEEKCLCWLEGRVGAVARVLQLQQVDLTEGAAALSFKHDAASAPKPVDYTRYAFGIVSQYLSSEIMEKLREKLNLPEPEKETGKRVAEAGGGPQPKKMKLTKEEPTEDYTKGVKKGAGKEADLSAKQKALAKSAEGSKSIMSFFKKK